MHARLETLEVGVLSVAARSSSQDEAHSSKLKVPDKADPTPTVFLAKAVCDQVLLSPVYESGIGVCIKEVIRDLQGTRLVW